MPVGLLLSFKFFEPTALNLTFLLRKALREREKRTILKPQQKLSLSAHSVPVSSHSTITFVTARMVSIPRAIRYVWKVPRPKGEDRAEDLMEAAYYTAMQTDHTATELQAFFFPEVSFHGWVHGQFFADGVAGKAPRELVPPFGLCLQRR